jgi:hypothetical protein
LKKALFQSKAVKVFYCIISSIAQKPTNLPFLKNFFRVKTSHHFEMSLTTTTRATIQVPRCVNFGTFSLANCLFINLHAYPDNGAAMFFKCQGASTCGTCQASDSAFFNLSAKVGGAVSVNAPFDSSIFSRSCFSYCFAEK